MSTGAGGSQLTEAADETGALSTLSGHNLSIHLSSRSFFTAASKAGKLTILI